MNASARHLCNEIIQAVSSNPPADLEQKIKGYFADKFVHVWCAEDIVAQAAMGEHGLTPAEIQSILDDIEIDSSIGMNWDVIEVWIDDALRARKFAYPKDQEFYADHQDEINRFLAHMMIVRYGGHPKPVLIDEEVLHFVERCMGVSPIRKVSDVGKEVRRP